uniref:G2/mitotic-specific cyclin-B n=1 Tax=Hydra viridissima TaxID=6082 RepID=CCNB_HYDVD|nr:RecName: Full=G2/mitotic-specific cyclin-B [Hydra viridissima]CAA62471.1 cyclin B [Hydra viridissima]
MAGVQRRILISRNEENLLNKGIGTKNVLGGKTTSTRTALSNISNIQRRPQLGGKVKKEDVGALEEKAPTNKSLGRMISQTNLLNEVQMKKNIQNLEDMAEVDLPINSMIDSFTDLEVDDIDLEDLGNPTLCAEYVKDIYKYMNKLEQRLVPGDYMPNQTEINFKMRSILVDWLIQVQSRFNLLQETLYLTIYILDRFLNKQNVKRAELQLVGVTAMLLASKYEEMYAPEIGDFVYITDNAYSKEKIRQMEQKMLKACEYDFSNPLCLHFLRRNSKAGAVDAQKHTLAKYLMELTLVEYEFITKLPSEVAAAALYLSMKLIDDSNWTPTLVHYSGYTEDAILPTVSKLSVLTLSMDNSKYQAVKNKYAASKFLRISRIPQLKGHVLNKFAERI